MLGIRAKSDSDPASDVFGYLDKNQDDKVSLDEFSALMNTLMPDFKPTEQELEQLYGELGKNGTITREDFARSAGGLALLKNSNR